MSCLSFWQLAMLWWNLSRLTCSQICSSSSVSLSESGSSTGGGGCECVSVCVVVKVAAVHD